MDYPFLPPLGVQSPFEHTCHVLLNIVRSICFICFTGRAVMMSVQEAERTFHLRQVNGRQLFHAVD